jgi:hypothetical protein
MNSSKNNASDKSTKQKQATPSKTPTQKQAQPSTGKKKK